MHKYTSLNLIQEDLRNGKITCQELVETYLSNIEAHKDLNALVEVYAVDARAKAKDLDQKLALGKAGKLAGMVVTLKDVLCYQDHKLTAGSKILNGFESQFNGTAVQKLLDEDAIVIGRSNCDEFGMGSSNENSAFGNVHNAIDKTRVSGGSSGGSAVAVQTDMCLVSLGSDTGGSVRQPAAFCGIIGLKPTYSRISRHGLIAYGSSFDCIGIFAKDINDVALVLEIISGYDLFDSTVSKKDVPSYIKNIDSSNNYKVAYIGETLHSDGLNEEIKSSIINTLNNIEKSGNIVAEVDFPLLEYILPTYYILTTAEASSNLSRYDGVKYGYRSKEGESLEEMYKKTRSEGFGEEVKRRIMLGTFVLSASYYDAYYKKAQQVRRLIRDASKQILSEYDFIITPTTPTTAFKLGKHQMDPLSVYLADIYTVQASLSGLPAISIPTGKDKQGLPIGTQIIANDFEEEKLLAFSKYLMKLV